jgi:hypothetical protein
MAGEKDVVLIHYEDKPLSFARIEEIRPDVKPGWYQVKLLLLQVPLQLVTWILRPAYIDGEPFTMNGKPMRLEPVPSPPPEPPADTAAESQKVPRNEKSDAKVISLAELKKK